MNSKIFSVIVLTLLSTILLLNFSSATGVTFVPSVLNVTGNPGSQASLTFLLNNTETAQDYNLTLSQHSGWTIPASVNLTANQTSSVTVIYNISSNADPGTASSVTLTINGSYSTNTNLKAYVNQVNSISLSQLTAITKTQNGTINISNNGNAPVSMNLTSAGFGVKFSANPIAIGKYSSQIVNVSALDLSKLVLGDNGPVINAIDLNTNTTTSLTMSSIQKSFCANGPTEKRNLTINDITISAVLGTEDKWKPLDTVTIEVEVKNIGQDTVDDVSVEMALFNKDTGEDVTGNLDFNNSDSETIDLGSISDGDRETAKFQFKVPADFDKATYKLAIKTYSKDLGEDIECIDSSSKLSSNKLFKEVRVERESDQGKYIAFDEVKLSPSDAVCGDSITMSLKAANVGNKNQRQIKVNLFSKELGIDLSTELKNGLDQGEDKLLNFVFNIPQVVDKTYTLSLIAYYDYSDSTYHQSSDEATRIPLKVFGCSLTPSAKVASITADLTNEPKAGSPLTIKATIKNLANTTLPFVVSAKAFDSWAELSSISDQLINLAPGESKDVTITLNVKNGISGKQNLLVEARSSDKVSSQEVEVDVAQTSWFPSLQGNTMIWLIGALNVVLVLIIIIVAVKVARR